jgi:hypothetical protein
MLDGELQNITRQQFIIEPLQPRVLLSATVAEDVVGTEMTCVMIDLLPAGEFVESESPQEPVGDPAGELAAGEEVFMYTMLASETDSAEDQIEYTTLQSEIEIPAGEDGEVIYYTMVGEENPENLEDMPVDGGVIDMPEEWVYMTGVGSEGPNVYHPLNDNPEILQTGVESTDAQNVQAPPAQSATFARLQAQPAVARSVLSLDSQDLLASPNDVLV